MEARVLTCINIRHFLADLFARNDIKAFRQALHTVSNSVSDIEDPLSDIAEEQLSVFEMACQTPGSSEFYEACLAINCDVNKVNINYNKCPINFAVESFDSGNLTTLLVGSRVFVDFTYSGLTPINFLANRLTDDNFDSVFGCIKLLVNYGANLNIPSRRNITPILCVLRSRQLSYTNKNLIVSYLLEHGEIDIVTHRWGETRTLLWQLIPEAEILGFDKID